jgi:hypothetical protein
VTPDDNQSPCYPPAPIECRVVARGIARLDHEEILSVAASASEWTRGIHSLALAATNALFLEREKKLPQQCGA